MEFLLYKKEKKFFTTTQHICNMCVFQYTCIVYINFALLDSNPDAATTFKAQDHIFTWLTVNN